MTSPSSANDRLITAAAYGLTMMVSVPLISIAIAWLFYHLFRGNSLFVEHHLKQNFNLISSLHLYLFVLSLFYLILPNMGGSLDWITEKFPVVGITLVLGGVSSIFFIIIGLILIMAVYIVLVIFSLFGQWVRVPLIIRFVK